ncbi:MAG: GNAT family N-acetyltransferase [Paracoccaceae bacterium]
MNDERLSIRHAAPADLPGLLALYQHLTPDDAPPSPEVATGILNRFLRYPGSAIFLAQADATLVGSCVLVVIPNLTRGGQPYGLVENVVTHGDYRRRGIGRQLLDAATDAAWSEGCYKLMLLTGMSDAGTLAFYEKAGFAQSKTGFQKRRIATRG